MIELAVFLLGDFAKENIQLTGVTRSNICKMHEEFLDSMFGSRPKLDRQAWIDTVSS